MDLPSIQNRFEILFSDDEQVEVFSTVLASEGAVRVARRRNLVLLSDSIPVTHRVLQPTIPDAGSEDEHHIIGTPVVRDIEDPASDDTLSVVGGGHVGEEASVSSEDFESVAGDEESLVGSAMEVPQNGDEVMSDPEVVEAHSSAAVRLVFSTLEEVDLTRIFRLRASVMKTIPSFLRGPFRTALRLARKLCTQFFCVRRGVGSCCCCSPDFGLQEEIGGEI